MMPTEVWTFLPEYFTGIMKIELFQNKNKTHNYVSITLDVQTQCIIFEVLLTGSKQNKISITCYINDHGHHLSS